MRYFVFSFFFLFVFTTVLNAQNISVASFELVESDLTANTEGTMVYDQNGDKCALIKIETTKTGFSFDVGSLGVVKIEQHVGEIWLYVPSGVKRVSISHAEYGTLRDYDLGLSVQKARTYLLKLKKIKTATSEKYQDLRIIVEPANAVVMVDDDIWDLGGGKAVKSLPLGVHTYTIIAQGYYPEAGSVTLDDSTTAKELKLVLKPDYTKASADDITAFSVNGVSFNMVSVKGGTFKMGATPEQAEPEENEKPVHSVTLSDYSIGETEVTKGLWNAVMGENEQRIQDPEDNMLPADFVSWSKCQEFIEKLNSLTGKNFRLPTEAEWEFAARGGNKSKGYLYSGSNDAAKVAWFANTSNMISQPVMQKEPNELGIYDMSGNVDEWCQDVFKRYSGDDVTNPQNQSDEMESRVVRGGCYRFFSGRCRVSFRDSSFEASYYQWIGFRLAM